MRVVIFGQKWLAVEVLKSLLAMPPVSVAAVCPDIQGDRFTAAANAACVPVVSVENVPQCELGVAAHCQQYIPADVRARCGFGVLGYHPSLLPRHRGRDAVHWTLAMRDPVAGGSAYWMDDGADTGPIESQNWCHVLPEDTPGKLWRRELAPMGLRLMTECVARLAAGVCPRAIPQDERAATWEPSLARPKLSQP